VKIRIVFLTLLLGCCTAPLFALPMFTLEDPPDYFLLPGCNRGLKPVPNPLRVSTDTLQQHHLSGAMPVYPEAAKKQHLQGTVVLSVDVDKQGSVSQTRILAGNPLLAAAAQSAVKQWKYRPVVVDGTGYAVTGDVLITFGLGLNPWAAERGESPLKPVSCPAPGGTLAHSVEPEAPPQAKIIHLGGDVVLQITIDKQGRVADAKVVSGHGLLVGAAQNAVKQWRYQPYTLGDAPVAVKTFIAVKFRP
jgi:TonB family protein